MQQSSATQSLHLSFWELQRLLHVLTPPHSAFLYLQFLARCQPYILLHTRIHRNEVGYGDDTVQKRIREGPARQD